MVIGKINKFYIVFLLRNIGVIGESYRREGENEKPYGSKIIDPLTVQAIQELESGLGKTVDSVEELFQDFGINSD